MVSSMGLVAMVRMGFYLPDILMVRHPLAILKSHIDSQYYVLRLGYGR